MIKSNEIKLEKTCDACPEQYDAFYKDRNVGYIRLRYGYFRVNDFEGNTIFSKQFRDQMKGCFEDSEERERFLTKAKKAIAYALNVNKEINANN